MKLVLQEILNDIRHGENLDTYIAILLNMGLAILSITGTASTEIVGAAILASLSWLIFHALIEHKKNSDNLSSLSFKLNNLSSPISASVFFSENYITTSKEFQNSFQNAKELFVMGHGQNRMIASYATQIAKILSEGGKIKFILMDPNGSSIETIVKRGFARQKTDLVRQQHQGALDRLIGIQLIQPSSNNLEIKLIDLVLPYTIYGFDWSYPEKARIYVWLTPFKEPSERRPGFVLINERDPKWFEFFRSQFEKVWSWDEAKEYKWD